MVEKGGGEEGWCREFRGREKGWRREVNGERMMEVKENGSRP